MSEELRDGPSSLLDGPPSARDRVRDLLSDRRALAMIGAALLAVIALAVFVVVPKLSSSGGATPQAAVARGAFRGQQAQAVATPAVLPVQTQTAQLKVRDPFSPLYVPPTAAPPPVVTPSAPVPVVSVTVAPAPNQPGTPSTTLLLTKIDPAVPGQPHTAEVVVSGQKMTVTEGKPFASHFEMTQWTATKCFFAYGDRDFSLTPGEFQAFF